MGYNYSDGATLLQRAFFAAVTVTMSVRPFVTLMHSLNEHVQLFAKTAAKTDRRTATHIPLYTLDKHV